MPAVVTRCLDGIDGDGIKLFSTGGTPDYKEAGPDTGSELHSGDITEPGAPGGASGMNGAAKPPAPKVFGYGTKQFDTGLKMPQVGGNAGSPVQIPSTGADMKFQFGKNAIKGESHGGHPGGADLGLQLGQDQHKGITLGGQPDVVQGNKPSVPTYGLLLPAVIPSEHKGSSGPGANTNLSPKFNAPDLKPAAPTLNFTR